MQIEQIYTGCIAEAAYYITSNGEAAIVDPLRETQPYLDRLQRDGVKLKYIFETHFHADFVSGHVDLAKKTGAVIVYGPTNMKTGFECHIGTDSEIFPLGNAEIKLIHTPGHTMESSCFLLIDENEKQQGLITGDTLFIGDVGRPDLAQHVIADLTQEKLAGHLYDSLRNKIMPLNDDLIVYPNHGAGSACGKNMSKETTDTLGNQKATNYALNPKLSKEEFIKVVLDGLTPPPGYFPQNVMMNINGYESFDAVKEKGIKPLTVREFEVAATETKAIILDTRKSDVFCNGFIPGALNIGIKGDFAPWAGTIIVDIKTPIILVTEVGEEEETVTRLTRVGFDNIIGHLKGGFETWKNAGKEIDMVHQINAEQFAEEVKIGESKVIDVRKESEYAAEHVEDAYSKPLAYINNWIKDINPKEHFYLHCAAGYRSMIAASILKSRGYSNFTEVQGGFSAIAKTNVSKTNYVCQSKVLQ
ncbi:MAG: MBL fold metallo-hydrolase [Chitinophagaceae bacterium]|nr:MBL fold metallo-hydrolase [Chitinophagaceae bacterium]